MESIPLWEKVHLQLIGSAAHRQRTGRPFVTLSYAQSLDGSIAARSGYPLEISGSQSMVLAHRLRAVHDAVLVGIGTILSDDPLLSVRLVEGPDPQPVVVDSRLRFPVYSRMLRNSSRRPWVATAETADMRRQIHLEERGARILRLPASSNGQVRLESLLDRLSALSLNSLLVEGGAQIIASFLTARLVDQIVITISPLLVGGLRPLDGIGPADPARFPRLHQVQYQRFGEDVVLRGDPEWSAD
ncbi:MAG: dihydrofolate reductase family protein [Deltaproteobacteria bacterium]|nr:dihydrofolate reductase family protein [Deltaproteobacteria bacterium]